MARLRLVVDDTTMTVDTFIVPKNKLVVRMYIGKNEFLDLSPKAATALRNRLNTIVEQIPFDHLDD